MDWECTEELMQKTYRGKALYMHCLPADISGESCERGEVQKSVFDRYRVQTYKEASNKPYVIAAMMLLTRMANPAEKLMELLERGKPRVL
jgi:ornithine carbamoyltransferase